MTYLSCTGYTLHPRLVCIKAMICLAGICGAAWMMPAMGQTNIPYGGGPVMQTATVYLVFWLPPNNNFDTAVANGIGNYETLLTDFFVNVAPSTYYSVVGQYTGMCNSNTCLVQNAPNAVHIGATFVVTGAYPHAGTQNDPLLDADIQNEVQSLITQYGLSDGVNAEFFVYVGSGVQECLAAPATGAECTFFNPRDPRGTAFCAYHSSFTDSRGNSAVYAVMPVANGLGAGCNEGVVNSPSGQISSDREVVLTTHEFFESVSDPLGNGWSTSGTEIGDNCNQQLGITQPDGSNVTLNGARFVVQQMWSNFTSTCSLGLPSVQLQVATGGDDLRGDSSATVSALSNTRTTLQTFILKPQNQPGFAGNTIYSQMFGFSGTSTPQVGAASITLTSHNALFETDDNWNIQGIVGQVFDAIGNPVCQFAGDGSPLMRLTGAAPTGVLAASTCAPPPPHIPPVGRGSAMTSWVQSDGPHVVYDDANGNVYQLWYTIRTGQWAAQSLMTVPNAVPVGPGSAMTSWVQSDGPHVAYADANGNVNQLWYTISTGQWAAQSLMTVPNAVPVGPGSAMTSWVQSDGPHVVYADANGNVNQLWYTISTGQWAAQSLMTVPNMVPVGRGSAMTSWVQSDGPHIVYADANGNVNQLWYTISTGQWAAQSLMNVGW